MLAYGVIALVAFWAIQSLTSRSTDIPYSQFRKLVTDGKVVWTRMRADAR